MSDDRFLQDYIKKLMDREMDLGDAEPLTEQQLKDVAYDMGMSDSEWQKIKADAKNAEDRGFEHLDRGNFEDALIEFKDATSSYPNSPDAFYGMAKALFKKSVEKEDKSFSVDAIRYIKRALKLNPDHTESLDLQSHIRRHENLLGDKIVTKGRVNKWKKILIPVIPIAILFFWLFGTYNSVVSLEEDVEASWAQVENVCNRRADLIPQLVKVVKAAAKHEKDVITEAIEARSKATAIHIDPSNMTEAQMKAFAESQSQLGGSLGKLLAVAERYPEIKAMANYQDLQNEITGSENRISTERRRFNETVKVFNKKVKRFPVNLLPFSARPYFEVPNAKLEVPELDL